MRILLVSPLDRRTVPNTRERNIAAALRTMGHATLTLTLTQNTSRAWGDVLRDTLRWRVERLGDDWISVDPPCNPCTGLKTDADAAAGAGAAGSDVRRRRVIAGFAPLGVLRDLPVIPAFVLEALRHGRFDLCIAYGPWAAAAGDVLVRLGRVGRLIYDDQDYEPAIIANRTRQRWTAWLERAMMRRAHALVCIGHRLAALRRQQTGRDAQVIPNGVRLARASAVREDGRPLTLVYVGNVVPWSGLDVLLEALPILLAAPRRLRVWIVGDGLPAYVAQLRERSAAPALHDTVRFVGRVPHERIVDWLARSDVGLAHFRPVPYRRYAFPLKVVEYMAAGLAVIGTRDTETEDILARHGAGVAVDCEAHAVAAAIARFDDDRAWLRRCRERASSAAADYRWPDLAARVLAAAEAPRMR